MTRLDEWEKRHRRNLANYERQIDEIFKAAAREAASIVTVAGISTTDKAFSFSDYPVTKKKLEKLLNGLKKDLELTVINGINTEWTLSNNKNSELANRVFGDNVNNLTEEQSRRYYTTNDNALQAFRERKTAGLNLSDRVWNYTEQFKSEIEMGIDMGLRDGLSADELSRELRDYLQHPDKLFRRVRDEHGLLQLSMAAKAFHPGRGVYRSSYKNARRLAATEINMAYRTADFIRWQQLDFVVGIEIRLSNNHTLNGVPFEDICDLLKGKYPKDFKFVGWHPHCRCHAITILKSPEEMADDNRRMLAGQPVSTRSVNTVSDVPENFKTWISDNEGRLEHSSSVPYFITDNPKYTGVATRYGTVGAVTGTKLGRTATKVAFKIYGDMPAPTLSREVQENTSKIASFLGVKQCKPMTFLEANEGRGNIYWGKGFEYSENCQITVVIHEARLRGLNVTALGYSSNISSVSYRLGERFQDIWEHPKTHKTPSPSILREPTFDTMLVKLENLTKPTGRYHIGINMRNGGHIITAERLPNGQMIFYDAQCGTFLNIEEYADRNVEYLEILKVDKLLLRGDLFKAIAQIL